MYKCRQVCRFSGQKNCFSSHYFYFLGVMRGKSPVWNWKETGTYLPQRTGGMYYKMQLNYQKMSRDIWLVVKVAKWDQLVNLWVFFHLKSAGEVQGQKVKVAHSCPTLCNPMDYTHSPWNSPGQTTGVGSRCLLQGIFPTQELNPGHLHCRQNLYQLSHQGSPRMLVLVSLF